MTSARNEEARLRALARELVRRRSREPSARCPEPEALADHACGTDSTEAHAQTRRHLALCDRCLTTVLAISEKTPNGVAAGATSGLERMRSGLARLVSFDMPDYQPVGAVRATDDRPGADVADALQCYAEGRYDAAVPLLEQALTNRSPPPELPLYLGACYLRAGRLDDADHMLQRAARRLSGAGTVTWLRAQCALAAGDAGRARRLLERLAASRGGHRARARALLERLRSMPPA